MKDFSFPNKESKTVKNIFAESGLIGQGIVSECEGLLLKSH